MPILFTVLSVTSFVLSDSLSLPFRHKFGADGWTTGLLAMNLCNQSTSASSSTITRFLSSPTNSRRKRRYNYDAIDNNGMNEEGDGHEYEDDDDDDDDYGGSGSGSVVRSRRRKRMVSAAAMQRWWNAHTSGSRGLLVYLIPSLLNQLAVLQSAVPFCADRLSQYLQPIYIFTSLLLLQRGGPTVVQSVLWSSIACGLGFMLADTYNAGSTWLPLRAKNDSYAVVTGASGGIGMEMARLLYRDGFSLVLISRDVSGLQDFRDSLEREPPHEKPLRRQDHQQQQQQQQHQQQRRATVDSDDDDDDDDDNDNDVEESNDVDATRTSATTAYPHPRESSTLDALGQGTGRVGRWMLRLGGQRRRRRGDRPASNELTSHASSVPALALAASPTPTPTQNQEIVVIPADLSGSQVPHLVLREMKQRGIADKVDVLVNNAGCCTRGALIESSFESIQDTVDLNIRATVLLTRLLAPRIAKRGSGGRIVFVGSLSSLGPGPLVSVYAASKAFVQAFALSLRRELMPEGVFVTLALPGATRDTKFANAAGAEDALVFRGPGLSMSASATATDVYRGMQQGRDVVVPGLANKVYAFFLSRLLPPAAVGALTRIAWSPAPSWLPFLRPLSADLQREQAQAQRRRRERQQALQQEEGQDPRAEERRRSWWPSLPSLPSFGGQGRGLGPEQGPRQARDGVSDADDDDDSAPPLEDEADDAQSQSQLERQQEEDQGRRGERQGSSQAWDGSDEAGAEESLPPISSPAPAPPSQPQSRQQETSPLPPSVPAREGVESRKDATGESDSTVDGGTDQQDALVQLRPGKPGRLSRLVVGPRAIWGLFGRLLGKGRDKKGEAASRHATADTRITSPATPEAAVDAWRRDAAGAVPRAADPRHQQVPASQQKSRSGGRVADHVGTESETAGDGGVGGWMLVVRRRVRSWVERFWDQPVINYPALRRFANKPFVKKGSHIVIQEDDEEAVPKTAMPTSPASSSVRSRAHVDGASSFGQVRYACTEAYSHVTTAADDEMSDVDTNDHHLSVCTLHLLAAAATAAAHENETEDALSTKRDRRPHALLRTVFAHDVPVYVAKVDRGAAHFREHAPPVAADRVIAAMLMVVVLQESWKTPLVLNKHTNLGDQTLTLGTRCL